MSDHWKIQAKNYENDLKKMERERDEARVTIHDLRDQIGFLEVKVERTRETILNELVNPPMLMVEYSPQQAKRIDELETILRNVHDSMVGEIKCADQETVQELNQEIDRLEHES